MKKYVRAVFSNSFGVNVLSKTDKELKLTSRVDRKYFFNDDLPEIRSFVIECEEYDISRLHKKKLADIITFKNAKIFSLNIGMSKKDSFITEKSDELKEVIDKEYPIIKLFDNNYEGAKIAIEELGNFDDIESAALFLALR